MKPRVDRNSHILEINGQDEMDAATDDVSEMTQAIIQSVENNVHQGVDDEMYYQRMEQFQNLIISPNATDRIAAYSLQSEHNLQVCTIPGISDVLVREAVDLSQIQLATFALSLLRTSGLVPAIENMFDVSQLATIPLAIETLPFFQALFTYSPEIFDHTKPLFDQLLANSSDQSITYELMGYVFQELPEGAEDKALFTSIFNKLLTIFHTSDNSESIIQLLVTLSEYELDIAFMGHQVMQYLFNSQFDVSGIVLNLSTQADACAWLRGESVFEWLIAQIEEHGFTTPVLRILVNLTRHDQDCVMCFFESPIVSALFGSLDDIDIQTLQYACELIAFLCSLSGEINIWTVLVSNGPAIAKMVDGLNVAFDEKVSAAIIHGLHSLITSSHKYGLDVLQASIDWTVVADTIEQYREYNSDDGIEANIAQIISFLQS